MSMMDEDDYGDYDNYDDQGEYYMNDMSRKNSE